jgi:transcriptional regulator with XRE-family HTH domain
MQRGTIARTGRARRISVMTPEMLGQRIEHYRLERGWNKTELGARIGLSHASIVRLEKGTQNISVHLLFALADTLKVTLWQLIGDEDDLTSAQQLPPSIHHLVKAVRHLNDSSIQHLTAFVLTVQESC